MHELSGFGSLNVAEKRQGRRVQVAVRLSVGDIEIPAPKDPHLLLVPENVANLRKMWDALRMPTRNNLLITGESGSGKTTLVRYLGEIYREVLAKKAEGERDPALAAHMKARASAFQTRILSFHENLRRSDITERRHYGETGEEKTGWTMSDVMEGVIAGDWNILSEINRTGEDVWAEFNDPLENKAKTLHQRVIRGHPDSRFIATVNPFKSEGRGIYEGKVMSGEFMNRFTNKVHLRYLPPDQEFEVLADYGPDVGPGVIDRLIGLATDIRRDYSEEHGVVPFPVTTRALIRMVRHLQRFPGDVRSLRSLFWRKAYWLDDQIHPPLARRLVEDLLDLHDIVDSPHSGREKTRVVRDTGEGKPVLRIGTVEHPLGTGGSYVPDTVIEEVDRNIEDLEWIAKDMVLSENVLLIGEAGVGKNKLESYLAHLLRANLLVIGMSGETRVSDLLTYRSFGEEEAGKTGDTATLGLRALTDSDQLWMIVLDEANKAQPGVLVSFNDLLQDRVVRLPGGAESPVRASIFVNINPNRPPYEVNDFSFEFMDRFSIHTIVHLPTDQAVEVLRKKYPDADEDFVRDIVEGYYALHPLYSGGVLFEPVTMRNEEAAIERGLQYRDNASNLIDLICSCYGARDARELDAVRGALQAAGFDRSVLPGTGALDALRESWEQDRGSEEKAFSLAATYRAIGKPTSSLQILSTMITGDSERDWVFHLGNAQILLDSDKAGDALAELRKGFSPGRVVRMGDQSRYLVIRPSVRITQGQPRISIEAAKISTGCASLIMSAGASPLRPAFRRASGEFLLTFTDTDHGLAVYEQGIDQQSASRDDRPVLSQDQEGCLRCEASAGNVPLGRLVEEYLALSPSGSDFRQQFCRLPSPPWTGMSVAGEQICRTVTGAGWTIRAVLDSRTGTWAVEILAGGAGPGRVPFRINWTGSKGGPGQISLESSNGGTCAVPAPADPFVHLGFSVLNRTLFIVLADEVVSELHTKGIPDKGDAEGVGWRILAASGYWPGVLRQLHSVLSFRVQEIFRYARPLPGYTGAGAGDVVYSIEEDSTTSPAILEDIDGMGPGISDLSISGEKAEREGKGASDRSKYRFVIPFAQLDACEEKQAAAFSPDTQEYLREVRGYLARAFFQKDQPRDLAWEVKARAILAGFVPFAGPVVPAAGNSLLSRGDILVRTREGEDHHDPTRSVLVVDFVGEEADKPGGGRSPRVRGFWLAEKNPVATGYLDEIGDRFSLIAVAGDDTQGRIVRRLAEACLGSGHPWKYSRSGTAVDPVIRFECSSLVVEHRPMYRQLRLEACHDDRTGALSIEETGYPAGSAVVDTGGRAVTRWQGSALVDIAYEPVMEEIRVILGDDLAKYLQGSGVIDEMPFAGSGVIIRFIPRSVAEEHCSDESSVIG
ncbi:MAG: AAA family ATPase [Methanoregulaceae archaeon]|nr:AAA family ATPase [Methanoregulaceae archaeon]